MPSSHRITLALDTTTRAGGIALLDDGVVRAIGGGDRTRTHGERLPGDILALLEREGVRLADVTLFAVAAGPGGFTGLRVGMATVQGLALVQGAPVVAVSALEAWAWMAVDEAVASRGELVGVCLEAHRGEIFGGLYEVVCAPAPAEGRTASGRQPARASLRAVEDAFVSAPGEALHRWANAAGAPIHLVGDAVDTTLATRDASATVFEPTSLEGSLAAAIGQIGVERAEDGGATAPHALRPLYVRRPDAEIARGAAGRS